MPDQNSNLDQELMRRWVETWRRAGRELDEIRRREIEATDTAEAIRQLFGSSVPHQESSQRTTSGLVEQQAWFAKLRRLTPVLAAALELQTFFDQQQWKFCIIGGIALLRWGEPRFTRDIDVSLLCGFGREEEFIAPLLSSAYRGRIPDAGEFARRNRVLLLDSPDGIPIDIALAGLPFEARMVERASLYEFEPGCCLRTCSAEDLMVLKLFAFRTRDVADVETIVVRQRGRLDWAYVEMQLSPLAAIKEQKEIMEVFHKLRRTGLQEPIL